MKFLYIFLLTLPLVAHSFPAAEEKSVSLEDEIDSEHAESGGDSQIQKRSGSFDYVTHLKSGLLSSIGHASASIASGSSGSSSGGYKSVEVVHGNSLEYDPWSFKKSVLNTIFQAVKAITGGVTALKGQLIKGSGYALSASGNLVAAGGDKVTDVGKAIINSAHANTHTYAPSTGHGAVVAVHPFSKFASLSGASSGGSSGSKHVSTGPVIHTETISTYEIPPSGHGSYGPPSKPPTYSSATHQYLPPGPSHGGYSSGGGGAGVPFSGGHAAFEAPPSNYLPSGYGQHDGHDDFNIYGRHKKLTDKEARKAAAQLQEILHLLPSGKTEFTASKTVTLDTPHRPTDNTAYVTLPTYGHENNLGPLESLSHTESITAAYAPQPPQPLQQLPLQQNPSDVYHHMVKKQSPEEIYIQKHPNEGYDYQPPRPADSSGYKYENYHASGSKTSALEDLSHIIAALDVAKRNSQSDTSLNTNTQYTVQKNVYKLPPPPQASTTGEFNNPAPVLRETTYTYYQPPAPSKDVGNYGPVYQAPPAKAEGNHGPVYQAPPSKNEANYRPVYHDSYKVRRQAPKLPASLRHTRKLPMFKAQDYEIQDPLLFNRMLTL